MEKFKVTFKQMILSVETKFWLKYYIISLILSIALIYKEPSFQFILLSVASFFLYPFAILLYDSIINLFFGETTMIVPIIILIPYVMLKTALLYVFSIFIGPIGIIFLFIYSNYFRK